MLAEKFNAKHVQFPVMVSNKIDGHRSIRLGDRLVSRNLSDIPNKHIRECLTKILPSGMDLELCVNHDLRQTSTIVRHKDRPISQLDVYILDWVIDEDLASNTPFRQRYKRIQDWYNTRSINDMQSKTAACANITIHVAEQTLVHNMKTLNDLFERAAAEGEEGIMIRDPDGIYVQSRSKALQKWKRWEDSEARIIDVVVAPGEKRIKALTVEWNHVVFNISSGLTRTTEKEYYQQRSRLKNKLLKFKYQDVARDGSKMKIGEAPRHAIILDIRDPADL